MSFTDKSFQENKSHLDLTETSDPEHDIQLHVLTRLMITDESDFKNHELKAQP